MWNGILPLSDKTLDLLLDLTLDSIQFGNSPSDILKDFANLIKKLCSEELESTQPLEAFTAIRLIPLDKNPDLGPVGVGEALKRMRDISADIDTDAILLMDAENALNSMNRNVMQLHQGYLLSVGERYFLLREQLKNNSRWLSSYENICIKHSTFNQFKQDDVKEVTFADNISVAGSLNSIKD